jgi:hypothetical protein
VEGPKRHVKKVVGRRLGHSRELTSPYARLHSGLLYSFLHALAILLSLINLSERNVYIMTNSPLQNQMFF